MINPRRTKVQRSHYSIKSKGPHSLDLLKKRLPSHLLPSLVGQLLAMVAVILPLAIGNPVAVVVLVQYSAVAGILNHPCSLAICARAPVMRDQAEATAALAYGTATLLGFTSIIGLISGVAGYPAGVATAVMTACMGLYNIAFATSTRQGNLSALGAQRLVYGILAVPLAVVGSLASREHEFALLWSGAASYAGATIWVAVGMIKLRSRVDWSALRIPFLSQFLRESLAPASAYLFNGISTQAPLLGISGLGSLATPWATASRTAGGWLSVSAQAVVPYYDNLFAMASRNSKSTLNHVFKRSLRSAGAVGGLGVLSSLGLVAILHQWPSSPTEALLLILASLLYWGTSIVSVVTLKYMAFLGHHRAFVVWEFSRFAAVMVCFALWTGQARLMALSSVFALSYVAYLTLARRAVRHAPTT